MPYLFACRWKPLQYFLRRYLFRDHLIAASNDSRILVRSDDAFSSFTGKCIDLCFQLATGTTTQLSRIRSVTSPWCRRHCLVMCQHVSLRQDRALHTVGYTPAIRRVRL